MRVPTTFRARRNLRSVVLTGLLTAYYNDAHAHVAESVVSDHLGVGTPGTQTISGWSGNGIQEIGV